MAASQDAHNRAEDQAIMQFESIEEMISALEDNEHDDEREEAVQRIQEDALDVSVRSDWHSPHSEGMQTEYQILLCTGGPAVRIVGDLNCWDQPETARIEYQDWFTSWKEHPCDQETLLQYAQQFYFGE